MATAPLGRWGYTAHGAVGDQVLWGCRGGTCTEAVGTEHRAADGNRPHRGWGSGGTLPGQSMGCQDVRKTSSGHLGSQGRAWAGATSEGGIGTVRHCVLHNCYSNQGCA